MLASTIAFTGMTICVKLARDDLGAVEIMFWRGLLSIPLAMAFAWGVPWRPANVTAIALRCLFGFFSMVCFFWSARYLAVADQTFLSQLQPVLVALLAPLLLARSESAGRGGLAWTVLGLSGTLILLAPTFQVGSLAGLAALGGTAFSALAHLALRRATATDAPAAIVLWFQTAVTGASLGTLVAWPGQVWSLPALHLWPALAGVALFAVIGQVLMSNAYARDHAPRVAMAAYVSPVWAVIADVAIWGAVPGWHAWVGGALVVAAGLGLTFRRA
jgi:drug/metabolite transporter (DMT)-like permease